MTQCWFSFGFNLEDFEISVEFWDFCFVFVWTFWADFRVVGFVNASCLLSCDCFFREVREDFSCFDEFAVVFGVFLTVFIFGCKGGFFSLLTDLTFFCFCSVGVFPLSCLSAVCVFLGGRPRFFGLAVSSHFGVCFLLASCFGGLPRFLFSSFAGIFTFAFLKKSPSLQQNRHFVKDYGMLVIDSLVCVKMPEIPVFKIDCLVNFF